MSRVARQINGMSICPRLPPRDAMNRPKSLKTICPVSWNGRFIICMKVLSRYLSAIGVKMNFQPQMKMIKKTMARPQK